MPKIHPDQEGYEAAIRTRLGDDTPWKAFWVPNHIMTITTSLPWVYSDIINVKKVRYADGVKYPDREPKYTDNDHILVFPQDENTVCPQAWIDAAWPFIVKFRSAFTLYPEQVGLYSHITLIGHPAVNPHIDAEFVEAIFDTSWRKVERIWCRNSKQLREILQARIDANVFFQGKDEGDLS